MSHMQSGTCVVTDYYYSYSTTIDINDDQKKSKPKSDTLQGLIANRHMVRALAGLHREGARGETGHTGCLVRPVCQPK